MKLRPKHFVVAAVLLLLLALCLFTLGHMVGAFLVPVCKDFSLLTATPRCRQPILWLLAAAVAAGLAVVALGVSVVMWAMKKSAH